MFYLTTRKNYSKMDINIDEENIIASVMKEEKNFVLSINYLTSQYFTFVLVLYNFMHLFKPFYCVIVAHIFELGHAKGANKRILSVH